MDPDPRHPADGRQRARSDGDSHRARQSNRRADPSGTRRVDRRSRDASAGAELFVPSLLAGLDADDGATRESAGDALCLLARESPSRAASLARELADGVTGRPGRRERLRVLAAIAVDHESAVMRAAVETLGRDAGRRLVAAVRETDPWEPSEDASLPYPASVARSHATPFRQVVTIAETDDGEREARAHTLDERPEPDAPDRGTASRPDTGPTPVADERPPTSADANDGATPDDRPDALERVATSRTFTAIRARSDFEDLTVQSTPERGRYAKCVRTRAERGEDVRGVEIRLVPAPSGASGFAATAAERLQAWTGLADVEGVVTAHDFAESPRPWVATDACETTLAGRERPPVEAALAQACRLSAALVACHERGVVHGGIDPGNVAVDVDHFGGEDRVALDNVGLVPAFRPYADLDDLLDVRYAAPELVDRRYGDLDAATDVYGLGMVVYRLCTGHDPFADAHKPVEERVLRDRLTPPSQVREALPDRLDQVVARATATQKLTRYESAEELHEDLRAVARRVLD